MIYRVELSWLENDKSRFEDCGLIEAETEEEAMYVAMERWDVRSGDLKFALCIPTAPEAHRE